MPACVIGNYGRIRCYAKALYADDVYSCDDMVCHKRPYLLWECALHVFLNINIGENN